MAIYKQDNQRVMTTKRLLHEALLKMLETQNINRISIRDLCKTAGINRTTFYNHYASQFEVLDELAESYLQSTAYTVLNEIENGKDFKDCLIQSLYYIKNHLQPVKLILNQNNYDLVSHIRISFPEFNQMVIRYLPDGLNQEQKRAFSSFVQYGALRVLEEWIFTDCVKSPEEEGQLLVSIMGTVMSNLY